MPSPLRLRSARLGGAVVVAALFVSVLAAPSSAQDVSFRIGDETEPTDVSISLSAFAFSEDESPYVVLGRNDVFADNLAGAALTGGVGPLLLIDPAPAPLADRVLTEIERVLPPSGDCASVATNVYVLGGQRAVDEAVVADLRDRGYCVERLSGPSRVETSVAVASTMLQMIFADQPDPTTGTRGPIMIARDDNPADSATAGAYAAAAFAPIVVTNGQDLNPAVADLLQPGDTAWTDVSLLGGTAALSDTVQAQVSDAVTGQGSFDVPVSRVAGASRDDTAFQIATQLWPRVNDSPSSAMIVNGFGNDAFWQYALPAGALGGHFNVAMLYVATDSIPGPTDSYLRQQALSSVLTVGPESEISEATRAEAEGSLGSGVTPDNPDQ